MISNFFEQIWEWKHLILTVVYYYGQLYQTHRCFFLILCIFPKWMLYLHRFGVSINLLLESVQYHSFTSDKFHFERSYPFPLKKMHDRFLLQLLCCKKAQVNDCNNNQHLENRWAAKSSIIKAMLKQIMIINFFAVGCILFGFQRSAVDNMLIQWYDQKR